MSNNLSVIKQSTNLILPTDPDIRQKIKIAVKQISDSKTRIEAEKEFIKETVDDLSDQYQLPKSAINKIATLYHKQSLEEETSKFDDVLSLYDTIFKAAQEEE